MIKFDNSKLTVRFSMIFVLATMLFGTALVEADAQTRRRRPALRKAPVVRKAPPRVMVYSVASGEKIRVRLEEELSSKTARVGDTFTTRTTDPVYSTNGVVVIPEGSTILGRVSAVTAARKGGKPGTIDVSFTQVRLPNGTTRAINGSLTDLNTDDGRSNNEGTATGDKMKNRKIIFIGGGGAGGALLGAAVGGGKGALIGAIVGAGAGLLGERMTKGEDVEVKSGTEFGVILNQSVSMPKYVEPNN